MTTTIQMRIDKSTKDKAQKVFKKMGLDLSSGLRVYLGRVADTGKFFIEDEAQIFTRQSGRDILRELGTISKGEYDYYEKL